MRSDVLVVLSPRLDRRACVPKAGEPVQVQAVLAELAVEALDERILRRLTWLDEVQPDHSSSRPEEHRLAGQLGAVVADDGLWQRSGLGQPIQLAGQPQPRDREVNDLDNTLTAEVVDDIENLEATTVGELIGHEVDRPALVDAVRYRHRHSRSG